MKIIKFNSALFIPTAQQSYQILWKLVNWFKVGSVTHPSKGNKSCWCTPHCNHSGNYFFSHHC